MACHGLTYSSQHCFAFEIFILPPAYGYPIHFHARLLSEKDGLRMEEIALMLGYSEDISDDERYEIFKTSPGELRNWLMENAIEKNGIA